MSDSIHWGLLSGIQSVPGTLWELPKYVHSKQRTTGGLLFKRRGQLSGKHGFLGRPRRPPRGDRPQLWGHVRALLKSRLRHRCNTDFLRLGVPPATWQISGGMWGFRTVMNATHLAQGLAGAISPPRTCRGVSSCRRWEGAAVGIYQRRPRTLQTRPHVQAAHPTRHVRA